MRQRLALFLTALFVTGCVTSFKSVPPHNIVMFGGSGQLVNPLDHMRCANGDGSCAGKHSSLVRYASFRTEADAAEYRKALLDAMDAFPKVNGCRRVVIIIHGGLNTQTGTVKRAEEMADVIMRQGVFPIFVNWQTSWPTTYWDHLVYLRQGLFWKKMGPLTAPLYLIADAGRSLGNAAMDWWWEGKGAYDARNESPKYRELTALEPNIKSSGIHMQVGQDLRGPSETAQSEAVGILSLPVRIATNPLTDGLGTGAWATMRHRAHALFHPDRDYTITADVPSPHQSTGGLEVFLRELGERTSKNSSEWEITLAGHSLGTIVVNTIVLEHPDLPIKRVVYMAAAATVEDYQRTVVPYLQSHKDVTMHHLILNRRAEVRERFDGLTRAHLLYDALPRGSLLVWIDDLLTKPDRLVDRTVGRYDNLIPTLYTSPPEIASRIHVRAFDAGDRVRGKQPQKHSEVGDVRFWLPECVTADGPFDSGHCYKERAAKSSR